MPAEHELAGDSDECVDYGIDRSEWNNDAQLEAMQAGYKVGKDEWSPAAEIDVQQRAN